MQGFGAKLLGGAAVLAVPVAYMTKTYASFTDQMAVVRAVTNASAADFDRLTATAKRLGATTSFTASQVAAGMTSLGRAGFKSAEIDTAIAGLLDLSRAADTVTLSRKPDK